jgi:hypothetical protein
MSAGNEILIVTSSIQPFPNVPFLAIRDPKERLRQTLCALVLWIRCPSIHSIVLCDNTAPDYDFSLIQEYAKQHGKKMEIMLFKGNARVVTAGKGYGEGEILNHVLKNSVLLKESKNGVFYKITGRLFVSNFEYLHRKYYHDSIVFQSPAWVRSSLLRPASLFSFLKTLLTGPFPIAFMKRSWEGFWHAPESVSTKFYKCTVSYFQQHLMPHSEFTHYSLYRKLIGTKFALFHPFPEIIGRSGATGQLYGKRMFSKEVIDLVNKWM